MWARIQGRAVDVGAQGGDVVEIAEGVGEKVGGEAEADDGAGPPGAPPHSKKTKYTVKISQYKRANWQATLTVATAIPTRKAT